MNEAAKAPISEPVLQRPCVGIFRLQLFKQSETFIAGQVRCLKAWEPIYIGRKMFGPAPEGSVVALPKPGIISSLRVVGLRDVKPLLAALPERRIDLLHAHFAIDAIYALPMARQLGVPLVTTLHGFDVTTADRAFLGSGKPALLRAVLLRRSLAREGALFVCVSEFIRQAALTLGYPEERCVVLPIGIDLSRFSPAPHDTEEGLIVHTARLVEKKGTVHLLRALARIYVSVPTARLVIVGEGPLRAELEAEAGRLGLGERVRFLGARPHAETISWMRRASVIAVPSVTAKSGDSEGLPTVLCEAGALGVPVVASRTSGLPEAVIDGETGVLVPERDEAGLAVALSRLLTDESYRVAAGRANRALMEARFDVMKQTEKLEWLYSKCLSS